MTNTAIQTQQTENEVVELTALQLEALLMSLRGAMPIQLTCRTEPKMNKGGRGGVPVNPYYGHVVKHTTANVFINHNYTNSVNRQRVKEGKEADFTASERQWGMKVPHTPLVLHEAKQEYYLEARFLGNTKSVWFHNNHIIEKERLTQWLPKDYSNSDHQGLESEDEVIIRTYALKNVVSITMNGKTYIVKK